MKRYIRKTKKERSKGNKARKLKKVLARMLFEKSILKKSFHDFFRINLN